MRRGILCAVLSFGMIGSAHAWGQGGHSIVGEIAQRRLSQQASGSVAKLLGSGHSLASVGSWADDVRDDRPETYNWHFVDIPITSNDYQPQRDCKDDPKGDCVVAELLRLKNELRCVSEAKKKIEALKFAVHFIGDIHQPLHSVLEARGGNDIRVVMALAGRKKCRGGPCQIVPANLSLHAVWDTGLIDQTAWSWGAYVDLLEDGWLKSAEARVPGVDGGTPAEWAMETHKHAQTAWDLPADKKLDDVYYAKAAPILDRQLAVAGLRLARFLNEAYASASCPVQ